MQTALNLSLSRGFKEEVLYQNAQVNVLLWDKLNTPEFKKLYPSQNYRDWADVNMIARLLKMWCIGDQRPENGTFVGFRPNRKGKEIYPVFY